MCTYNDQKKEEESKEGKRHRKEGKRLMQRDREKRELKSANIRSM